MDFARGSKYSRTLITAYRDLAVLQEHRYGKFLKRHGCCNSPVSRMGGLEWGGVDCVLVHLQQNSEQWGD